MNRLSPDGPRELTLYVTGACDASCSFCARTITGVHDASTMRPEFVRDLLKRFPTVKGVCIAGFGEPLLVPWLGDIIAECRRAGAFVGLITNGSQLRRRLDEVASWDLGPHGYVSVSLNATNEADHTRMFGFKRPCFDEVRDALRALVSRGVNAGASFVVTRQQVLDGELHRIGVLARLFHPRFVHVHGLLPHGGPRDLVFLVGLLREGDAAVERALAEARSLIGSAPIHLPTLLPRAGMTVARCESPFMSIGVDAAGNVTGCRRVFEPSAAFGNISDPGVWDNEHFTTYRRELSTGAPNETCRACFGSVKG